jgi:hypothetical protein
MLSLCSSRACLGKTIILSIKMAAAQKRGGGFLPPSPAPQYTRTCSGDIYATPLRFKLGGRRIMSARFNVETAGSERKRPEI